MTSLSIYIRAIRADVIQRARQVEWEKSRATRLHAARLRVAARYVDYDVLRRPLARHGARR